MATALVLALLLAIATLASTPTVTKADASNVAPRVSLGADWLRGSWRFDEGSGTKALDSSRYQNDGTTYGATWVPGKQGPALSFDGTDDYVNAGNGPSLDIPDATTTVSVEMWVYAETQNKDYPMPFTKGGFGKPLAGYYVGGFAYPDREKMRFGISDGGGTAADMADSPATPPLNDGQWHHLVGYANRATGKIGLFLDGSLVGETSIPSTVGSLSNPGRVATIGGNTTNYSFKGRVDGLRVYSRAFSASEVAARYSAGIDQTVKEGDTVSFSGSFTDPGSADTHTIAWNFGDGGTASGSLTPTHVYADNGTYTATLTVTDDDGGVGSDTLTVAVNNVAPVADAGGPYQATVVHVVVNVDPDTLNLRSNSQWVTAYLTKDPSATANVALDGSGSHDPGADVLTYAWTIKDSGGAIVATLSGQNPVAALPVGTYMASLVVNDGEVNSESPSTASITVYAVDLSQIAPTSVYLNGVPGAKTDFQDPALMVKFDRSLVASTVQVGDQVQMVISGAVSGSDTIKVISQ